MTKEDKENGRIFAEYELELLKREQIKAVARTEDDEWADQQVLRLLSYWQTQRHDTTRSEQIVLDRFYMLAKMRPLLPIGFGGSDEWIRTNAKPGHLQNRRAPILFKNVADGKIFRAEGRVFRVAYSPLTLTQLTENSQVPVKLPWVDEGRQEVVVVQECAAYKKTLPEEKCEADKDPLYECSHCPNCKANNLKAFPPEEPIEKIEN
jgi:hypothetical protein